MPRNIAKVQPPGGRRVGAVEVMRRLDAVGELLAERRPRFVIVDDCCKRFGMSARTCDNYIRRVREQWAAERAEGQPTGRDPQAPMPRNAAKVQPPGGRRVGAAEVMRRRDAVGELLAEGRPRPVIVADCCKRFGMSARTCDDYIRRVREQWAAKRAEGRPTGRGPQAPTAPAPLALPASLPPGRRSTEATRLIGAPQTSSADSHTRHRRKRRKVAYDGKSQLWLTLLATGAKSIWPEITDAAQGHKMPIKRAKEIATKLIITWRNHRRAVSAVSPVIEKLKKLERAIQDAREAIERADEVLYTDPQVETFATDVVEFAHHMGRAARQIMTHKGWTADDDSRGDTFPPKCKFPHGEIPGDIIREAKAVALKQMAEQGISIAPADQNKMDRKPVSVLAIRLALDEIEERYKALQFNQIGQRTAPKHLEAFIEGALSSLPKNGRPSYHLAQNIAWLLQDAAEPGYPTESDEKVHVFLTENLADATSEIPTVRTIKHWRRKRPPLLQEYARLLEVRESLLSGRQGRLLLRTLDEGDPGGNETG